MIFFGVIVFILLISFEKYWVVMLLEFWCVSYIFFSCFSLSSQLSNYCKLCKFILRNKESRAILIIHSLNYTIFLKYFMNSVILSVFLVLKEEKKIQKLGLL